jgi:hypothetical protein
VTVRSTAARRLPARLPDADWESLEALPGRGVDHHVAVGRARQRRAEEGQRFPSDVVQIGEQATRRSKSGAVELAEAVEGRDFEPLLQALFPGQAVESGAPLLPDHFGSGEPGQFGIERVRLNRAQLEPAGRDIGCGKAEAIGHPGYRHQPVGSAGIEQRLFRQGAGGDDADDAARHQRLGAALFGFGRALGLLGDCDAEAALDQPG